MRTTLCSLTRCFTPKWLILAGLLTVALLPAPSSAQNLCLQDEYNQVNKQKLNCTANDVRIAKVSNVRDLSGTAKATCTAGELFSFLADFEIVTTSSQARENIGLYIATDSTTQALTGSCVDNIISPRHQCPNSPAGVFCGSDNYHETDAAPDTCGDTSSGDNSSTFGSGAELVTLEIDNFLCEAPAGSNQVQLPNCTSWQIPGGTIQCVSPSPTYPYPVDGHGKPEAIPGSPSKCNCSVIPLGVTVQSPGINVGKACNTADQSTAPTFSLVNNQLTGSPANCTLNPEGGLVTYTVDIANDASNFGGIVVDQVCDSAYGNVFTVAGYKGQPCAAGLQCTGANAVAGGYCGGTTSCTSFTVNKGASQTCTFQANQPENITVDNTVSVQVHGTSAGTASGGSNQVEVISHEATTTGTIAKTFVANTAACATVTYQVVVSNTSATGTDETLTLNSLSDTAFGDITTVHGSGDGAVLGTTCGQPTNNINGGTLSGTAGAGALPQTLSVNGGAYTCQFNAQFCGGITTVDLGNGTSCSGFQHANTVSANLTGDESEVVSLTPGSLTVKECVTPH
jgi:hypothetical protein